MSGSVRKVCGGDALLGEGPVWDARRACLWYVDIKRRLVHRYDPSTGRLSQWGAPGQIGWVLPAVDSRLVAGLQTGLAVFDPESGGFEHLADVEAHLPGNRLNDATVAADGSIWFGSMDDGETAATGRVYRFDGEVIWTTAIAPAPITNGPAISPDGTVLYHVDTAAGVVYAIPLEPDGGTGASRVFVVIDSAEGHPDGVSVDSVGNVWMGLWGGWAARCYRPDGSLLREVRLPASNVTKIALGGPALKTAYATTARIGLDHAALASQPDAGSVFAFDVEAPGVAMPPARLTPGR